MRALVAPQLCDDCMKLDFASNLDHECPVCDPAFAEFHNARVREIQKRLDDAARFQPSEFEVQKELARLVTKKVAQDRFAALVGETEDELPDLISLTDLLAMPDDPIKFRIRDLLPIGGRVILAAAKKTGKTTMNVNIVRSLVDGSPFLGVFDVAALEPGESVVIFDTEMSTSQLRQWLADAGVKNVDKVHAIPLRGRLDAFRIADQKVRDHWATQLRKVNAKVVIVDPLNPVLGAHDADENSNTEVSRVLSALDQLMLDGGVSEMLISHHMGHNGERSRGASKLGDWPDAEWKMAWGDDDTGGRSVFFSAFGRDVMVPESMLAFARDDRRLTMVTDPWGESINRTTVKSAANREAVMTFVTENDGCGSTALREGTGLDGKAFKSVTDALISAKQIHRVPGKGNAVHWHAGPAPAAGSESANAA